MHAAIARIGAALALAAAPCPFAFARPMSVEDTLAFREVRQVVLSPSGRTVAYVVRQANVAQKRNDDSLVVIDVASGASRSLHTTEDLTRVTWTADEKHLLGVAGTAAHSRILRVDAERGKTVAIWETNDPLGGFAVAPDGSFCLVSTTVFSSEEIATERRDHGLVFEFGRHTYETLIGDELRDPEWERFVRIDLRDLGNREIARIPFGGYRAGEFVERILISPDARLASVELRRLGDSTKGAPPINADIGVLDLQSGDWAAVAPGSLQPERGVVWLDSRRFFLTQSGRGATYDASNNTISRLDWLTSDVNWVLGGSYQPDTDSLYVQTRTSLFRLHLQQRKEEKLADLFAAPSFSRDHAVQAMVLESSDSPPEVAVVRRGEEPRRLTRLNPELDELDLGRVEKVDITNGYGTASTAYLVYPVGYESGRRYPLILGSYGFRGRFLTTAEWHTTFPVQTLAGQGYAVLLVNMPPLESAQRLAGNPVKAREHEGWQVLSTFEAAIQQMVSRGIADPDNLGLYGWSHGAFVVEFLLAHSKLRFRAACVGEGGDYNPSEYWLWGSPSWPRIFQNTFGGPFTARTAAAYLEFCPVLSVDKVNTPLLLEFQRESGILGLEFFVPLRMLGVPSELVGYDREEHNFVRPTVRLSSMHRKLDWFNFWMRDVQDRDPGKRSQYDRWQRQRSEWKSRPPLVAR